MSTPLDSRVRKSAEIVPETTFATLPSNPIMLGWGGYANPIVIKTTPTIEKNPYLKGVSSSNRMLSTKTDKISEAFSATVTAKPTSLAMLPFILGGSSHTDYTVGDNILSYSIGCAVNDEYEVFHGGSPSKVEYKFAGEAGGEMTAEFKLANMTAASDIDYIGTGSHAADPSGDILKMADISSVTYDNSAFSAVGVNMESITFGVEIPTDPVKNVGVGYNSNIGNWKLGQMNIYIEAEFTLDDLTIGSHVRAGASHKLEFTLAGKTLTFSDLVWENEFEESFDPEDVLGSTFKASNLSLSIA